MKALLLTALLIFATTVDAARAQRVFVNNWPDQTPFQASATCTFTEGDLCNTDIYVVPNGKRAVIEYVSGYSWLPRLSKLIIGVHTTIDGNQVLHRVSGSPVDDVQTWEGEMYKEKNIGAMVKLYAEQNTPIVMSGALTVHGEGVASHTMYFTVSGYLVDK